MSKQFAMLKSAGRLENHFSRERYNLSKMENNPNIPLSLLETKVTHFNELASTLNELFSNLTGSSEDLFAKYEIAYDEDYYDDMLDSAEVYDADDDEGYDGGIDEGSEGDDCSEPDSDLPNVDDVLIDDGLDVEESKDRMGEALDNYDENHETHIEDYVAEEDLPVEVLDVEDSIESEEPEERSTQNLDYTNHTIENVKVDNDPTQIANVKTAVEDNDGETNHGVDIEVEVYMNTDSSIASDILTDDDILKEISEN